MTMPFILGLNILNAIYDFRTVCRQFRCLFWEQLGIFNSGMSLLNWYNMVCIGYLFANMFSVYLQCVVSKQVFLYVTEVWMNIFWRECPAIDEV